MFEAMFINGKTEKVSTIGIYNTKIDAAIAMMRFKNTKKKPLNWHLSKDKDGLPQWTHKSGNKAIVMIEY